MMLFFLCVVVKNLSLSLRKKYIYYKAEKQSVDHAVYSPNLARIDTTCADNHLHGYSIITCASIHFLQCVEGQGVVKTSAKFFSKPQYKLFKW